MHPAITTEQQQALITAAQAAARQAYCPYSNYPVGAALMTSQGEIITGCNVENISYGLTNCAERTAIFQAISQGKKEFIALAVAGGNTQPASPCGACRQVLVEFCQPETLVFITTLKGEKVTTTTIGDLLPLAFSLKSPHDCYYQKTPPGFLSPVLPATHTVCDPMPASG